MIKTTIKYVQADHISYQLFRPEVQGYMNQCCIRRIVAKCNKKKHLSEIYIRPINQLMSSGRRRDKGLLSFRSGSGA